MKINRIAILASTLATMFMVSVAQAQYANQDLYVANYNQSLIHRVTSDGTVHYFGPTTNPMALAFGPDGRLYVGGQYLPVSVVTSNDGGLTGTSAHLPSTAFGGYRSMAFGPSGAPWNEDLFGSFTGHNYNIPVQIYNSVVRVSDYLTASPIITNLRSGPVPQNNCDGFRVAVLGIAFNPIDGNLYVAVQRVQPGLPCPNTTETAPTIEKVTPNGTVSVFATFSKEPTLPDSQGNYLGQPQTLAFDAEGNLFVGTIGSPNAIFKVTPDGAVCQFTTQSNWVLGLAFGPDGNLYASNYGSGVKKIDRFGAVTDFAAVPNSFDLAFAGGIYYPSFDTGALCPSSNPDSDGDGVNDDEDNCPLVSNDGQENNDDDGAGDVCDLDDDNDGVDDTADNCPLVSNDGQEDNDDDGAGDVCDLDDDNDGVEDGADNCPLDANTDQANFDGDDLGDVCDPDDDNDGVADTADLCEATVADTPNRLRKNRWTLSDVESGEFFQEAPQSGSVFQFTTADTGGCSCEQIAEEIGGKDHLRNGCSTSLILQWNAEVPQ